MKNGLALVLGLVGLSIPGFASAGQTQPKFASPDELTYKNFPGVPECLAVGVVSGDPASGPSTVLLKFAPKCDTAMHWHSANEQLVIVKGNGTMQVEGEAARPVVAGGYVMQPSKHPHRFICDASNGCLIYAVSDAKFDMHYVDDSGKEISLDEAQKRANKM
jgi:quercetin dioxygenase-like cupin family protein